uniref:Uncharacterized protein n=2 Tax=Meloidogyne TaxID=189290 RepID=A0A6V7WH65_MELEN|nr:unnamed protein product [Meloidogyne enterolobii]
MRRKSSFPFYFSPSILAILLFSISFQWSQQVSAYYSQQLFMPSGYLSHNLFGFQHPSRIGDSGHVNTVSEEPKMVIIEGEQNDNDLETKTENQNSAEKEIPRRQMRHLLADEFGTGKMGRQYKRMRPCFYSPIQCLMRKRRSGE